LTEKRLGGRGRGGSSGTWHAIAFDRRNPFVGIRTVHSYYCHVLCVPVYSRCRWGVAFL